MKNNLKWKPCGITSWLVEEKSRYKVYKSILEELGVEHEIEIRESIFSGKDIYDFQVYMPDSDKVFDEARKRGIIK